jgi:hypothetical protein
LNSNLPRRLELALATKPDAEAWKQTLIDVEVGRTYQGKPISGNPFP